MKQMESDGSQMESEQTTLTDILLRAGATVPMDQTTALLWALNRGDAQTVRALVQMGMVIPSHNQLMQEQILQAVQKGFGYSASFS